MARLRKGVDRVETMERSNAGAVYYIVNSSENLSLLNVSPTQRLTGSRRLAGSGSTRSVSCVSPLGSRLAQCRVNHHQVRVFHILPPQPRV
ncbi:hypothetical protein Pmani_020995 [Petrolisthes manimaculis]|uniref:Uncharacterized protein n=1 Tax=Petrolisthes manimaculis TaxID=1843537 RepID=A0AAE1PH92_9EUCA|nr:hypothetical protein Pmani_020995 [Petrolisthes manimaculis]